MITVWAGRGEYDVDPTDIVPWLFGANGRLDSIDVGECRVEADPEAYKRHGIRYLIEIDGTRRYLSEAWVMPWMCGIAVHNGMRPDEIHDTSVADRAQRVQALMVGHQRGWFIYHGFTNA